MRERRRSPIALPSAALLRATQHSVLGVHRTPKAAEKLHVAFSKTLCIVHGNSNTMCSGNKWRSDLGNGAVRAMSASAACFGYVR